VKYTIVYKKSAAEELLRLPQGMAYKVKTAIDNLAGNPRPPRCSKLKGSVSDYQDKSGELQDNLYNCRHAADHNHHKDRSQKKRLSLAVLVQKTGQSESQNKNASTSGLK
jgi:hypothetical protein